MTRSLLSRLGTALACACWIGAATPVGCSKPAPSVDAGAVVALAPVPAPAGLVAEMYLTRPDATWSTVRGALGGSAMVMPASVSALVATLLGLPIMLAAEIDGGIPIVGALVDGGEGQELRGTIGLHVRDGDRFIAQLTRPAEARFAARVDPASHMTYLETKADSPKGSPALAVLGNYLLAARTAGELVQLGPYVARTLPTKPMPKEELAIEANGAALAGPVSKSARAMTADAIHLPLGGIVQSALDILADAKLARLTAGFDAQGLHARIAVTPNPGGPSSKLIADLAVGDPKRMFDLPAESLGAFLFFQSPAARAASAASQAEALARLLDKHVPAAENAAIASALAQLGEARGDWLIGGVSFSPAGPAGFARGAVSDADKLAKGAKALTGLATSGPVKALLEDMDLRVSTGKAKVDGVSGALERVHLARLGKEKRPGSTTPSAIDLLYSIGKDGLLVATGFDAKSALSAIARSPSKDNLGRLPDMKAAIDGFGPEITFAVLFDPLRLGAAQAGKPSETGGPVAVAAGRRVAAGGDSGELWGRVDVATEALRELLRRRSALR